MRSASPEARALGRYASLAVRHAATARQLEDLHDRRTRTPWWSALARWQVEASLREVRSELGELEKCLADDSRSRDTIVWRTIDAAVHRIRQPASHRNAYHREILGEIDGLAKIVLERIAGDEYWTPRDYGFRVPAPPMSSLPAFIDALTPERVSAAIRDRVKHLAAVADDDEMLVDTNGQTYAQVQHRASGLRATFTVKEALLTGPAAVGRFGAVYSKPYRIESLSPDPDPGPWQWYVGLGIGTKIYRHGARLLPDVRWVSGVTAPEADGVRRRLHDEDPYVWRWSGCDRCRREGFSDGWADVDRAHLESRHE